MIELDGAKFEIYKDKSGSFRFRLLSEEGKTIIESGPCPTKNDCLKQIELFKKSVSSVIIQDRIARAQYVMSKSEPEEFLLNPGQPVELGGEIIAQKRRDGSIVLYEVIE